jgi:hypothetical protein
MAYLGFGKPFEEQPYKGFNDPLNTIVVTTSFVSEEKKDITYAAYNKEEHCWQFFSDDDIENFETAMRIVKLSEIILIDSSILELEEIPEGYCAKRERKGLDWVIQKQEI